MVLPKFFGMERRVKIEPVVKKAQFLILKSKISFFEIAIYSKSIIYFIYSLR